MIWLVGIWCLLIGFGVGLVVACALMELRFRADRRPGFVHERSGQ